MASATPALYHVGGNEPHAKQYEDHVPVHGAERLLGGVAREQYHEQKAYESGDAFVYDPRDYGHHGRHEYRDR